MNDRHHPSHPDHGPWVQLQRQLHAAAAVFWQDHRHHACRQLADRLTCVLISAADAVFDPRRHVPCDASEPPAGEYAARLHLAVTASGLPEAGLAALSPVIFRATADLLRQLRLGRAGRREAGLALHLVGVILAGLQEHERLRARRYGRSADTLTSSRPAA